MLIGIESHTLIVTKFNIAMRQIILLLYRLSYGDERIHIAQPTCVVPRRQGFCTFVLFIIRVKMLHDSTQKHAHVKTLEVKR